MLGPKMKFGLCGDLLVCIIISHCSDPNSNPAGNLNFQSIKSKTFRRRLEWGHLKVIKTLGIFLNKCNKSTIVHLLKKYFSGFQNILKRRNSREI